MQEASFSQWLKQRRKALDLTQEELAERAGCSIWTIRKFETGERRPSRQVAQLLASVLGIPPGEQPSFIGLARTALSHDEPQAEAQAKVQARPRLSILLLGPPRVECGETEIQFDTRKATALLAYLAVTRHEQSRDALAALLWPEYSQANARAALRRTLSTAGRFLPEGYLAVTRDTMRLEAHDGLLVDVAEFQRRLAEARAHSHPASEICPSCAALLTEAIAFYRDDFMSGFALRDSPEFDDWQIFQAESLRSELAWALERLAHYQAGLGDFTASIEHARRWLGLDRLHEPAHRMLMLLYAWSGRREAALQQYRECVQVLQRELDVAPLEATTRLHQAIRENRTPPPPARAGGQARTAPPPEAPATGRPAVPDLPLVGRDRDWAALVRAYGTVAGGSAGHLIALRGEAGIGKTRLADEFLRFAAQGGAATLTGRCYEGEANLAYGPVVESIRSALHRDDAAGRLEKVPPIWLGEASRLLPELQAVAPLSPQQPLDGPGAQSHFFEGLRQVLMVLLAGPGPGVLFFDDLHWADSATLDFVAYLSRRLQDWPACLLLAWRSGQSDDDDRLAGLAAEMARHHANTSIELQRLERSEVNELLAAASAPGLADRLYSETEGLPFFLVEYLNAMSGEHPLDPGSDPAMLVGVRALLESRLRSADEAGRQLLSAAAVIGRSFDFDTLREASGRSEEETLQALERLLARGLVVEVPPVHGSPAYDFSHEKLRRLVYEETSLARRRLLHRRVADALLALARGARNAGALMGQVAYHYQAAGNEAAAAEYYRQAGDYSSALYANSEAIAQFRTALALGHPDTAALHEAIGDLDTLTGEYGAALASYETAAALYEGEDLAGVEHKLGIVYGRRGSWEQAQSHFEEALTVYGEQGPEGKRARVYADWGLIAYRKGDGEQARTLAARAYDLATSAGDVRALAQSHNMLGLLASSRGEMDEALGHFEKSLSLAGELNDLAAKAAALNNLALAFAQAGDLEQALRRAEEALALSAARGDRHREAAIHSSLADFLHTLGKSSEAMPHLKQAVAIYSEIGVEAGDIQPAVWRLSEW